MAHFQHRLRWRFDFAGKPSKFGFWSRPGCARRAPEGMASLVNKDGLVRASIEAESPDFKVTTLAECDGHDFVNFEWIATARVPWGAVNSGGKVKMSGQVAGLRMHSRDAVVSAFVDKSYVQLRPRTVDEKKANLAGFGR